MMEFLRRFVGMALGGGARPQVVADDPVRPVPGAPVPSGPDVVLSFVDDTVTMDVRDRVRVAGRGVTYRRPLRPGTYVARLEKGRVSLHDGAYGLSLGGEGDRTSDVSLPAALVDEFMYLMVGREEASTRVEMQEDTTEDEGHVEPSGTDRDVDTETPWTHGSDAEDDVLAPTEAEDHAAHALRDLGYVAAGTVGAAVVAEAGTATRPTPAAEDRPDRTMSTEEDAWKPSGAYGR